MGYMVVTSYGEHVVKILRMEREDISTLYQYLIKVVVLTAMAVLMLSVVSTRKMLPLHARMYSRLLNWVRTSVWYVL